MFFSGNTQSSALRANCEKVCWKATERLSVSPCVARAFGRLFMNPPTVRAPIELGRAQRLARKMRASFF